MDTEIQGFPNYRINKQGQVFSNYKYKTNIPCDTWREVKPVLDKGVGYFIVTLTNQGKRSNKFIHRLLATHFIPNPLNKPQVNHIDGNKQNNDLSNLEWVTSQENSRHAVDTGLCDERRQKQEVAILQYNLKGNFVAEHVSLHEASRTTGIAWQNISKVVRGVRPRAGGYTWKYK